MRWLGLLIIWLVAVGLPLTMVYAPQGSDGAALLRQVPQAPGDWQVEVTSTLPLASDPFSINPDQGALLLQLAGGEILMAVDHLPADHPHRLSFASLAATVQEMVVQATPVADDQHRSGALRLRVLRDGVVAAEQLWWLQAGSRLTASWIVDIPALEAAHGR